MRKFEYKEVEGDLYVKELNELGEKGWELTSTIFPASPFGGAMYIFKREIITKKTPPLPRIPVGITLSTPPPKRK